MTLHDTNTDDVGQLPAAKSAINCAPASSVPNTDAGGRKKCAKKATRATPPVSVPVTGEAGQRCFAKTANKMSPVSPVHDSAMAGQPSIAEKATTAMPSIAGTIKHLQDLQVRRKFYINATNKLTNTARGLVLRALGFRHDADEKTREGIKARSARIVSAALSGKDMKPEDEAVADKLAVDFVVVAASLKPLVVERNNVEKQMKATAQTLPIAKWATEVRGLGELGLAVIIAEVGDFGLYASADKIFKRLGLAPFAGLACSTWRKTKNSGLTAEDWIGMGYSPRRRAEIYSCVGEPLFRQQSVIGGPYKQRYLARRERTAETHPDWTKGHSHNDALRIMTKCLVEDMYDQWWLINIMWPLRVCGGVAM